LAAGPAMPRARADVCCHGSGIADDRERAGHKQTA
jgi:hypothetical protein